MRYLYLSNMLPENKITVIIIIGTGLAPACARDYFFFSGVSRLVLRPTHHPMQWVSGGKATGA
jgi:hypothetical protein